MNVDAWWDKLSFQEKQQYLILNDPDYVVSFRIKPHFDNSVGAYDYHKPSNVVGHVREVYGAEGGNCWGKSVTAFHRVSSNTFLDIVIKAVDGAVEDHVLEQALDRCKVTVDTYSDRGYYGNTYSSVTEYVEIRELERYIDICLNELY